MASYEQISKGNWRVTISLGFDENGKRIRLKKQGFKTKKQAEVFVTETLNKKNKGYITPVSNNILFKDFICKWFDEYKSKTLSINTYTNYKSQIDTHIIPLLGSYKLTDITNAIIQDFYNKIISNGLKPSSAKKVMQTLNGCFKYAKKNKLIYVIPTDIEKVPIEKTKIQYWSKDEIDFFLNSIKDTRLYTPILIDILTGLRIGELCGLRWEDINLEEGFIEVNNQVINDKINKTLLFSSILKTSTSHRIITIPNILIEHLKAIKEVLHPLDSDFIVTSANGTMCNPRSLSMSFTKQVSKYKEPLEVMQKIYPNKNLDDYKQLTQITFHALRHTHATLLIFNGENIKVVSERLGHKDITTTLNTYVHVMKDMKNNTAKLLDSLFK